MKRLNEMLSRVSILQNAPSRRRVIAFLALCIISLLCVSLVCIRSIYIGYASHLFLMWNLFLAWVPFLISLVIYDLHRRGIRQSLILPFAALWLLFFPNAPYILTDFVHLGFSDNVPLWYDIIMISSFAWSGLLLGYISLFLVQRVVNDRFGNAIGWATAISVLTLGSFGIYMGRFGRWNSWDLFLHTYSVLESIATRILHPFSHSQTVAMTFFLSAFLILTYFVLVSFINLAGEPKERRKAVREIGE